MVIKLVYVFNLYGQYLRSVVIVVDNIKRDISVIIFMDDLKR